MAVTFDAATESSTFSSVSSVSWSHTPSGTPTGVAIVIADSALVSISTVKYNNVSLTQKTSRSEWPYRASIWGLANPSSGTQTAAITFSGSTGGRAVAITVTDGDTTTIFKSDTAGANAAFGSNPSVTVANVTSDDLVVDALYCTVSPTVGANQTTRLSSDASGQYRRGSTQPGSAGGQMSWSMGSGTYAICACAFAPAAAASASLLIPTNPMMPHLTM